MFRTAKFIAIACSTFVLASGVPSPAESTPGAAVAEISAERCKQLLSSGGVFIFYEASCPICQEYFPTIERLNSKYGANAPFYLVLKADDDSAIKSFVNDYHPHETILNDKSSRLQAALGARVTPQAFLVRGSKTIYSGRIDDRYHSIGHRRSIIGRSDLEDALSATAEAKTLTAKTTEPVGCYLEQDDHARQEKLDHVHK